MYVHIQASNIAEIVQDECIEPASDVMLKYDQLLAESIDQPKEFWSRMALKTLLWAEPFTKRGVLKGCDMSMGKICWFDGKLNASGMFGYTDFSGEREGGGCIAVWAALSKITSDLIFSAREGKL